MKKCTAWHFLGIMIFLYLLFFFLNTEIFWSSFDFFTKTLSQIFPIFLFIFVLMVIVNKYINRAFILKHIRGNKIKSWIFIILGGIISTGPPYLWYPLLKELKEKGVHDGEIAAFLYNRSIKPAFFPLMILYFGLQYTITLSFVVIFLSFFQAGIVNFFMSFNSHNS